MSLNKLRGKQCLRDHECCADHERLKRQIDILQGKLRNAKQDLSLAERVNVKLLENANHDKSLAKVGSLYGLSAPTTDRLSTDRQGAPEVVSVQLAERHAFQEELERVKNDYDRKARHMEMQIERINEDAKGRVMMIDHKYQLQIEKLQQQEWQFKNYIDGMEIEIRNLQGIIHRLERDKQLATAEKQEETKKVEDLQRLNKCLEAECTSIRLQMAHLKESMKEIEASYEQLNKQLFVQKQLSKQAMLDSRTRQEQLAFVKTQLRLNSQGRERLHTHKQELEHMVNNLQEYALDSHKREHGLRRKLAAAHQQSLTRAKSITELRDPHRFRFG